MTTYADPTRCPDCRALLPHDPQLCRVCSLPLTGETAISLFTTFQEADRLLGVLRAQKRPAVAAVPATARSGALLDGVTPYPAPGADQATERHHAPSLSGASVPKILLSLGALCLLVAAVTFLAVAWQWLGVGGRTVVLVALTGTALGLSVAMHTRIPASRRAASGATPQPRIPFERGQCATATSCSARSAISSSSAFTQCAAIMFESSIPASASARIPVVPGGGTRSSANDSQPPCPVRRNSVSSSLSARCVATGSPCSAQAR